MITQHMPKAVQREQPAHQGYSGLFAIPLQLALFQQG